MPQTCVIVLDAGRGSWLYGAMPIEEMTSRQRFLSAACCQPVDRPPVWIMRQAGRYLPEYRALKERYDFLTLVSTPELAAEVTMQPLKRFPTLDAAIIFSDILVIPEALGQPYHFRDQGGIGMDYALDSRKKVEALDPSGIQEKLGYVGEALRIMRGELGDQQALLGFGGSPWTLATYMVEGGSSKDFARVKALFFEDRECFEDLMEKLTAALADYFEMQIEAGVDAIQIFDSWGAQCPGNVYFEMSAQWIARLVKRLSERVPVIVYAKGMAAHWQLFQRAGASVLGVDWTVDLPRLRHEAPDLALQGNLDPTLMTLTPEIVRGEAVRMLESVARHPGYIANLGHGITPQAKIECVQAFLDTVAGFRTDAE